MVDVLVGANACGFESLGAQLFILVGDEVNAAGEVIDTGALTTQVKDADLGIGDTAVEAGLGVRLWQRHLVSLGSTTWWLSALSGWESRQDDVSQLSQRTCVSNAPCSCSSDSNERDDEPS